DFRNKLIHVYEIIDYSIVWNAIQIELPSIQSGIQLLLQTLK
ncbi:HepT-like ribonuclease domain-containing protein, partial [Mycobacterium tuberculosis]